MPRKKTISPDAPRPNHPLPCLLALPGVDSATMDDGKIIQEGDALSFSSDIVTLHHTATGAESLQKLLLTLEQLPCVCRFSFLPDSITLRRAKDGGVEPYGPCHLRFRMADVPACERCPRHPV